MNAHILRTIYHALISVFVIVPTDRGLEIILDGKTYEITVHEVKS